MSQPLTQIPDEEAVDAIIGVRPPQGGGTSIAARVKTRVEPRDVPRIVEQLRGYNPEIPHMVIAPYISPATQALLRERGVGYADLTGNIYLAVDSPPIFISDRGADSDPWRDEARPLRSLKGRAAGRVVRALCDYRPPYGIRELAQRSATPVASVSRVVALLEREALLERDASGSVTSVDWEGLIRRWTDDYGLTRSNRAYSYIAPRGVETAVNRLPSAQTQYAVTGSFAAAALADQIAAARLAAIFTDDPSALAAELDLRVAEAGANVLLLEPFDPVVFDRTTVMFDTTYVAASQAAADLLTGPGRSPAEGEELLRWMRENEDAWRH